MILVNDKQVEFTKFPDGTTSFRYNPFGSMTRIFNITWKYDGDEECILLWYLVNHIRDHDRDVRLRLLLPYIPNARMDRVKNADEVFTLKWFAEFINTLDFDDVLVDDPHSNVSAALLATVYKGNIIKNLIMDCQSYTKYRPNETTGGIFVSWRRKEELPTGA